MPREYAPEVGGYLHARATKEALDAIEIAIQVEIVKLRAMRNNEETRATINDLHEELLIIFNSLITIRDIGQQHREFRTAINHQEPPDAE